MWSALCELMFYSRVDYADKAPYLYYGFMPHCEIHPPYNS
jgi:hypothetical protein